MSSDLEEKSKKVEMLEKSMKKANEDKVNLLRNIQKANSDLWEKEKIFKDNESKLKEEIQTKNIKITAL